MADKYGREASKLQSLLKNYLDAEYIELFTNGHMALDNETEAAVMEAIKRCKVRYIDNYCASIINDIKM